MTIHIYHPQVWDPKFHPDGGPVLDDECPRCQEHAEHPEATLDPLHQTKLMDMFVSGGPYLSDLDRRAAGQLWIHNTSPVEGH
jgi:hypothetical protein